MGKDGKRQQILLAAVGKGTIYQYFEDKEDLFFQVTSGAFDDLCALLTRKAPGFARAKPGSAEAKPGDRPFEERLLDACVQVAAFFRRHRPLFVRIQAEEARMACSKGRLRERWMEKRVKLVQVVADILRQGVTEGKVRSDIEPEALAEFLLGMIRTSNLKLQSVPESARRLEMVTDMFCNGATNRLPIADPATARTVAVTGCRLPNGG